MVFSVAAKSPKRGVSENEFQFKAQMAALAPGVSWFYNWGNSVGRYLADETSLEFVPMCWNGSYNAESIRTYCAAHPEVKYLLGFNEPNFTNQANMTPEAAAAKWPEVQALAAELGLKLVAPALNYSPNPPYQSPTAWFDEFVALVGKDAFDYLAVHSYGGFNVMRDLATTFHDRYGKDVWVTEFCYWPEEGNPNSTVSPESQVAVMMQSVEWLEKTPWIHRYAWFKAIGNSSASKGPNFGLLLSGKSENERELSVQGKVYLSLPEFDTDCYHPTEELIPAVNYITQSGALLGANNDETVGALVEVVRFNGGASIDYQFDVPSAGLYYLVLRAGGMGDPTRFDPSLAVLAVNADGTDGEQLSTTLKLTLTNDDYRYENIPMAVTLPAGRQTLRIKDMNPYSPSGIRFSAVKLTDDPNGSVDNIAADMADTTVDVYSMQGMILRRDVDRASALDGMPAGMYIVGSQKIYKQ